MQKTPLGSWDSKTGTWIPAPQPPKSFYKEMMKFAKGSLVGTPAGESPSFYQAGAAPNVPTPSPISPALGQHLFYGGTPAKTPYKIGCKPGKSTTFKKQKRHELIARMENASLPEAQIATLLGLTVPRLRSVKQHPDYLKARMKVTLGIIVDQDASLDQIREQRKDFIRQMLPPALQVIANAIQTPAFSYADRKLQVSVAQDLLDREGTFAKISRSEVKPVEHFDWESTDAGATSVIDVIKGTLSFREHSSPGVESILEISRAFSTGQVLSSEAQQSALKNLSRIGSEKE